eukprot:6631782-Pyramimonas_sp.AAC.1
MPILGIPVFFEGESLRLPSPFGVSILGIGIRSRLVPYGRTGARQFPPALPPRESAVDVSTPRRRGSLFLERT